MHNRTPTSTHITAFVDLIQINLCDLILQKASENLFSELRPMIEEGKDKLEWTRQVMMMMIMMMVMLMIMIAVSLQKMAILMMLPVK